jgi:hypothetical protein
MNRLAVHQSLLHPRPPVETIELARAAGWDSIGLHIGAVEEAEPWWSGGAGQRQLEATIGRLLETRVTVLDVGRVVLTAPEEAAAVRDVHDRVLDFGARLGAQFVTVRFGGPLARGVLGPAERAARLAAFADQARPYRLRPLLSSISVDRPDLFADAAALVGPCGGGLVLDVPVHSSSADLVSVAVVDLWEHLGYVRVDARALERDGEAAAGQLAVLPPHVPVVIGGDDGLGLLDEDPVERLARLRTLVDHMLEHPRARALRSPSFAPTNGDSASPV